MRILFFLIPFLISACNDASDSGRKTNTSIPAIHYVYSKSYPHDTTSFTEGFLIHDGELHESTGATDDLPQTKSLFGIVDLITGKIQMKAELDREKYFGKVLPL
jgi:glutaminyl-peptide cyclotransferase